MYAVLKIGGRQFVVGSGDRLKVEKMNAQEGQTLEFEPILIRKDDGSIELNKGKVLAETLGHGKHRKVHVFKFRAKKNYKRWKGHRQPYTEIMIKEIKEA